MQPAFIPRDETLSLEAMMKNSSEHSLSLAESSERVRRKLQNLHHIRGADFHSAEKMTDRLADATEEYVNAFAEYALDICRIIDAVHVQPDLLQAKLRRIGSDIGRESLARRELYSFEGMKSYHPNGGFRLRVAYRLDEIQRTGLSNLPADESESELATIETAAIEELHAHFENMSQSRPDTPINHLIMQASAKTIEAQIIAEHSMQPIGFIEKDIS